MLVYHGSTFEAPHPLCDYGRRRMDFGQGFYVTLLRDQAETWARRLAEDRKKGDPCLNIYHLDQEAYMAHGRSRIFTAYDKEWLHFIVSNRKMLPTVEQYDYIEGGIANDKVVDTINFYIEGLYPEDYTLRMLAMHQPNHQICLRNQMLMDKYLVYAGCEHLS